MFPCWRPRDVDASRDFLSHEGVRYGRNAACYGYADAMLAERGRREKEEAK